MRLLPEQLELTDLTKVLIATVAAQALVVMASLAFPVLAPSIAAAADIPPYFVGYYSGIIYGVAVAGSLATPVLLARTGGIRLHQWMLGLTALALLLLVVPSLVALLFSALLLGAAYGPTNPAGTAMLALHTPARQRGRIFSLKQTAVPIGGALAGSVLPALASALGWHAALVVVTAACVSLALLIRPWRTGLDRLTGPDTGHRPAPFVAPTLIFGRGGIRAVAFASFAFGATQFSFSAVFPTVLSMSGWSTHAAGIVLAVALVIGVVCRVAWGAIADRLGLRRVLAVLGAIMSICAFVAILIDRTSSVTHVMIVAALFGLSSFCWAGIALAETVRHVAPSAVSQASAAVIALTFCGALVGPALFSTIALLTGDFRFAFPVLGILSAAATAWLAYAELNESGSGSPS